VTATVRPAARVVLFDFDGVLFRADSYTAFVRERYRRDAWRPLIALATLPVLAVLACSRRGRRRVIRILVAVALLGIDAKRYEGLAVAFGKAAAKEPRNFLRPGLDALRKHRAAGDRVIVVTGGEQTVVQAILDALGIGGLELVASRLRASRWGMRIDVRNRGEEKIRQLALRGVTPRWGLAYSDSIDDVPMLAAAAEPVLVNVDGAMLARIAARLGRMPTVVYWD
jgi:phosphatidylglycerophosphatase C